MEENNYCLEEMKREADASIKIDALCKFVSSDDESETRKQTELLKNKSWRRQVRVWFMNGRIA